MLEERSRASRYRLDQQHVAAALARGGSIGECRRLLERLTQGALPPAIEAQLSAWDAAFGALVLRPAVVLEARSEALMDDLLTLEAILPFVRRRLGATVVDVPAAEVIRLVDALRTAGYLPRVDAALRLAAESRGAYAGSSTEPRRGSVEPRRAPLERAADLGRAPAVPGDASAVPGQAAAEPAAELGRAPAVPGDASAARDQAAAEPAADLGRASAVPDQAAADPAAEPGRGSAEPGALAEPGRGAAEPGRSAAEPGRGAAVSGQTAAERTAGARPRFRRARPRAYMERAAEAGRAYAGLVDEQVLEFLLVSLLAFSEARPERLAELEGALGLLERLERQFVAERLDELHAAPVASPATCARRPRPPRRQPAGAAHGLLAAAHSPALRVTLRQPFVTSE